MKTKFKYPHSSGADIDKWMSTPDKPTVAKTVPWPILLGWETEKSLIEKCKKDGTYES